MSKFWCIYRIVNTENGNTYIGQHKVDSLLTDDSYLGSGKLIRRAIQKYGRSSFKKEYITIAMTQLEADVLEKFYISKEQPIYNIAPGGQGGRLTPKPWNKGLKMDDDFKKKDRLAHLGKYDGEKNPFYGKCHTDETKEKLRKPKSDEVKKKMSESAKGRIPWNKGKKGVQVPWNKGKKTGPLSEETKKKLSDKTKKAREERFWSTRKG